MCRTGVSLRHSVCVYVCALLFCFRRNPNPSIWLVKLTFVSQHASRGLKRFKYCFLFSCKWSMTTRPFTLFKTGCWLPLPIPIRIKNRSITHLGSAEQVDWRRDSPPRTWWCSHRSRADRTMTWQAHEEQSSRRQTVALHEIFEGQKLLIQKHSLSLSVSLSLSCNSTSPQRHLPLAFHRTASEPALRRPFLWPTRLSETRPPSREDRVDPRSQQPLADCSCQLCRNPRWPTRPLAGSDPSWGHQIPVRPQ